MDVTKLIEERLAAMIELAVTAGSRAYAPYSNFPVGAALLLTDGMLLPGCNVENASIGLTNCAERTALFSMVAMGRRDPAAMAIYTPTREFTTPCGACRQVLQELAPGMSIMMIDGERRLRRLTVTELLPFAFDAAQLRAGR